MSAQQRPERPTSERGGERGVERGRLGAAVRDLSTYYQQQDQNKDGSGLMTYRFGV